MHAMKQLANGIWRLSRPLGPTINTYLVGSVLVDTGRRQDAKRILKQLADRNLDMVLLTHAHPDHQGSASAICDARSVPLACHQDDVDAMEGRRPVSSTEGIIPKLVTRGWGGPARPVDRVLREDDEIAGLRVVHAPGHAPGEIILFREQDRVALCGDVIRNISYFTGRRSLGEPPDSFNDDSARNRDSIRRLAALNPSLILPGHGPGVIDMDAFARFAAARS